MTTVTRTTDKNETQKIRVAMIGQMAGWVWTIVAGGGGLAYLMERGPMRMTNGWFALLSGIAACPLTAAYLRKHADISVSGRVQLAVALLLFIAGRIALGLGL